MPINVDLMEVLREQNTRNTGTLVLIEIWVEGRRKYLEADWSRWTNET